MILGRKYYWLFQLFGWGCFFLWHIFNAWSFDHMTLPEDRTFHIQRAVGFSILGMITTHCLRIVILRIHIINKKVLTQIWLFLALTIFASFIAGVIELFAYSYFNIQNYGEILMANKSLILVFTNNATSWFSYFIIWSAVYFIYHYVVAVQKEQVDTLKLKSHVKELELKTIKTHINPHFIFNALNGIRAMIDENPKRARNAITELSNILRSSINIHKAETVTLAQELDIVKDYLALEQMRFEDRLRVEYDIADNTTNQSIPPMVLQMLVENAIKHGISHQINGGLVKLKSFLNNNLLNLSVENTGQLKEQKSDGGFGITSIREQLKLMYGDNSGLSINQTSDCTVEAQLQIPVVYKKLRYESNYY